MNASVDFIPVEAVDVWAAFSGLFFVGLLVSLAAAAASILVFRFSALPAVRSLVVLAVCIVVSACVGVIGVYTSGTAAKSAQGQAVCTGLGETYGVDLSKQEHSLFSSWDGCYSLDIPTVEPEADFKVFGTASVWRLAENGVENLDVTLVWQDDKFWLAAADSAPVYEFLPATR